VGPWARSIEHRVWAWPICRFFPGHHRWPKFLQCPPAGPPYWRNAAWPTMGAGHHQDRAEGWRHAPGIGPPQPPTASAREFRLPQSRQALHRSLISKHAGRTAKSPGGIHCANAMVVIGETTRPGAANGKRLGLGLVAKSSGEPRRLKSIARSPPMAKAGREPAKGGFRCSPCRPASGVMSITGEAGAAHP